MNKQVLIFFFFWLYHNEDEHTKNVKIQLSKAVFYKYVFVHFKLVFIFLVAKV